tara:strand:+ start:3534 stop:3860 length:327 start_codon:yes stop_codon:yes gene_type:complete
VVKKRYTLIGNNDQENVKNVKWFRPEVDTKDIRLLMEKSDKLSLKDTFIWLGVMFISAFLAIMLSPFLLSVPFCLIFGLMYGSAADARWHECGYRTAFKTLWMNKFVY